MREDFFAVVSIFALSQNAALATLVGDHNDGSGKMGTAKTAHPRYFGPSRVNISGTGVHVSEQELCKTPGHLESEYSVRGKIVYTSSALTTESKPYCNYGVAYEHLDKAGAIGFVYFNDWIIPGFDPYRHDDWDACSMCDQRLVTVFAYVNSVDLETWSYNPHLIMHITSPHDTTWQDLITSWPLFLVVQLFLPVLYFAIAVYAVHVLVLRTKMPERERQSSSKAEAHRCGIIVCFIIAVSNTILGALSACGGFYGGKSLLPLAFYRFFKTYLDGSFILCMLIVTMFLQESKRASGPSLPPHRSMWLGTRGIPMKMAAILLPAADLAVGAVTAGSDGYTGQTHTGIVLFSYLLTQALIGANFLFQTAHLSKPLLAHFHIETVVRRRDSGKPIERIWNLISIFFMNGSLTIFMVCLKITILIDLVRGLPDPLRFLVTMSLGAFTRACGSYWLVVASAPTRYTGDYGHVEALSLRAFRYVVLKKNCFRGTAVAPAMVFMFDTLNNSWVLRPRQANDPPEEAGQEHFDPDDDIGFDPGFFADELHWPPLPDMARVVTLSPPSSRECAMEYRPAADGANENESGSAVDLELITRG